jgi:hypothetical protein
MRQPEMRKEAAFPLKYAPSSGLLAVARRDKSKSNSILIWPMLALGLDCAYAKHIDGNIHLYHLNGNMWFWPQPPA